jgi:hypothetical protein
VFQLHNEIGDGGDYVLLLGCTFLFLSVLRGCLSVGMPLTS